MDIPETRYADAGEVQIAYQVWGEGEIDLILVPGLISHIEAFVEIEENVRYYQRLARNFRLLVYDKRGQGLSDRVAGGGRGAIPAACRSAHSRCAANSASLSVR